jgi:flagellar protein FlaI
MGIGELTDSGDETEGEAARGEPAGSRSGGDAGATERIEAAVETASTLARIVDTRTVDTDPAVDEEAFFATADGQTTVANRYDLEKAVPVAKRAHFREVTRYWVNKPYSFVVIFHSVKENEGKYYLVEPHVTEIEADLEDFLTRKLKTAIKYSSDEAAVEGSDADRDSVIEAETAQLLDRYGLYDGPIAGAGESGAIARLKRALGMGTDDGDDGERVGDLDGIAARPEPAVLEEDATELSEYQVEKLLYRLKRDFIGYGRIDGIKHDVNVEDISCDGYNSPVFAYHSDREQLITNVYHGEDELDDFVVKLAQRSGKGISKRQPQVDATLPDGSRAQLTLGYEVSDHGTNYTIRQFKDVPFTPIDLINWGTFSLEEMAYIWVCIENNKSMLFAGGTASGKTTSLNAVSLFIPSKAKIVSIEDTRELEIPQRNWVASVTRPSFSADDAGDVDEFKLLEAGLRQRPDYILMGEVRGEEGRTLFQVMSTGHTTLTTFHADNVGEVIKRFTTDPINVSKTLFTALDLVSIQTATRVRGKKVRRNKGLTEINYYDAENDEINVQDVFQWQAETDEFLRMGTSTTLEEVKFDRGWDEERLSSELFRRKVVLAYLIDKGLNTYTEAAATLQAFINDPDTILGLIANDRLAESLEDLRGMESVLIDTDPAAEAMVPRPDPNEELRDLTGAILEEADDRLFEEYRQQATPGLTATLADGGEDADEGTTEPEADVGSDEREPADRGAEGEE